MFRKSIIVALALCMMLVGAPMAFAQEDAASATAGGIAGTGISTTAAVVAGAVVVAAIAAVAVATSDSGGGAIAHGHGGK